MLLYHFCVRINTNNNNNNNIIEQAGRDVVKVTNIPSTGVKVDYGNANDVRQAGCKQAHNGLTIEFQDRRTLHTANDQISYVD